MLHPLVSFLEFSSHLVLRILRIPVETASTVSEEEVKSIIAEGTQSGVFNLAEQKMMEGVLRLSDLSIKSTMTHRQDIVWIDPHESLTNVAGIIKEAQHSHYLLGDKSSQNVLGIVSAKDIVVQLHERKQLNLRELAQDAISIPENTSVHDAISTFRNTRSHIALVIDEYGGLEGIITLKDILEAIIGIMPEPTDSEQPKVQYRSDGSLLVDGMLPVYELESLLQINHLRNEDADFATLAGFILHHLERLPKEGDSLKWHNITFEILDMDERRIDKVLITINPDA